MKTKLRFLLLALSGLMAAASAEMVRVEGGTFVMTDCHNRKQRVTVSDFEIETTERGFLDNWWQAVAECNRMSRKDGYTPCYSINGITDERECLGMVLELECRICNRTRSESDWTQRHKEKPCETRRRMGNI